MILTIFLFETYLASAHTLTDSLFSDCYIEVCQNSTEEMDDTGKIWPHYCYKCPEGEDEAIFLREYFINGWKYVLGPHQKFQGRYLMSIIPCKEVEVDSMGNVWTSWCFENELVKFEKMGGRIWVYKQDFAGGYPQLQYRRILVGNEFLQVFKEKFEKDLHEGEICGEQDGKDVGKGGEGERKMDEGGKEEKSKDQENKKIGDGDEDHHNPRQKKGKHRNNEDPLVAVTQSVKMNLEATTKESTQVRSSANSDISTTKESHEETFSLAVTVSHLQPASDPSSESPQLQNPSNISLSLSITEDKNQEIEEKSHLDNEDESDSKEDVSESESCEVVNAKERSVTQENDCKSIESESDNSEDVRESDLSEVGKNKEKSEESRSQEKKCKNLEGDRAGRYFFERFLESGQKVEYELDRFKNFVFDEETSLRRHAHQDSFVEIDGDTAVPCKSFNGQGVELEFEPDIFIRRMFWEIKYEDGHRVKYLRAYLPKDKANGMYLVDSDTGYRLRAFI